MLTVSCFMGISLPKGFSGKRFPHVPDRKLWEDRMLSRGPAYSSGLWGSGGPWPVWCWDPKLPLPSVPFPL